MKTLLLPEVPDSKFHIVMEFLKALKIKTIQSDNIPYQISDSEKKFIDQRLQQYMENPNDVIDFDQFIKEIQKDL